MEIKKQTENNPYLNAKIEWLERYGDFIKQKRNWQIVAFISLIIAFASVIYVGHIGSQNKLIPYIIEVDKLGNQSKVGIVQQNNIKNPNVTKFSINTFVHSWRTIWGDVNIQRKFIFEAYDYVLPNSEAYNYLNNYYQKNNPFEKIGKEFTKLIPMSNNEPYLQVYKSDENFNNEVYELLLRVIVVQLLLLFIFATLSFYLAKSSLKPLKESIETLDKFAKDLIHDLNTPITAMKLNIKLLEKDPQIKNIKAIQRLNKSINTVTELHENLTVLLEKRTFQIISVNIFDIVQEVVHLHEPSYPNITFDISKNSLIIDTNPNALKEVLHNIISNACKYNSHNGYVRVYEENKILHIRNSGAEINETNKIFNRNYSEQNSSGIGLDIVKRLCDAMNIKIEVTSDEESNCFSLIFDK